MLTKLQVRIFFCNVCKKKSLSSLNNQDNLDLCKRFVLLLSIFLLVSFSFMFPEEGLMSLCHMSYPGVFVCNYDGRSQDRTFLLQRKHSHGHFVQHPPSLITISCKHPSYEIILQSRNIHFSPSVKLLRGAGLQNQKL